MIILIKSLDKISRMIYNELIGMEQKRNGKVEHGSNTHDDLVFSYLMAMYVWYEGKDPKEHFNILKTLLFLQYT